jgi:cephalosporin hydroxylase
MDQIKTDKDTEITIKTKGKEKTFSLYSKEGFDYLSLLWLKLGAQNRLMYEVNWMGVPFIQLAEDLVMMQELVWTLKPDVIVECGIGQGGGILFYSSILELIGKGKVIGVDIDIRLPNRKRIENSSFKNRIELIEGSSISPNVVKQLRRKLENTESVLIILDSDHTYKHVLAELNLYHSFVTKDSYLVVMDGGAAHVWDIPRDQSKYKDDHPILAIEEFLKNNNNFEIDHHYNRLGITSSPLGFLKKTNG